MIFKKLKRRLLIIGLNLITPLGWLYGLIMRLRNFLYNSGVKKVYEYTHPITIISIGNLTVGGTGKTPCIEYLLRLLQENFYTVVVSRGYKRKTHGYRIASILDNARTIGDEPYQLYKKFVTKDANTQVVVSEDRAKAIQRLITNYPYTEVILLDDGFQHRRVKRKLNLLLTSFHKPFFRDYILPVGRLREPRQAASRANIILVTKCPEVLTYGMQEDFKQHINLYCKTPTPPIFFTRIQYGTPKSLHPSHADNFSKYIVLVTGIADPSPLVEYVCKTYQLVYHIAFKDHHQFTQTDVRKIVSIFNQVTYKKKCILTTEKDSMRLIDPNVSSILRQIPVFSLPMSMEFIEGEQAFTKLIWDSIKK
ncbi:MAG: tetraacyldisaccharide 4'-kinase [Candidatus Amoebophilus sp.]